METKEKETEETVELEIKTEVIDLLFSKQKSISITKKDGKIEKVFVNGDEFKFPPDYNKDQTPENALLLAQNDKRKMYVDFLKNHFENLVVLSGAGTSVGWGGLTMAELWTEVENNLTPKVFGEFCDLITHPKDKKDLEALLSKANRAKEFFQEKKLKDKNGNEKTISNIIEVCELVIKEKCTIPLRPEAPHELLLGKLVNRKVKDPRVKIFTLNYDTLFEKAAIAGNFTVIDGFSYSFPRTLSGRNFDLDVIYREKTRIKEEESFVSRVFHLYKIHGSITWERVADSDNVIITENPKKPLMIFPKDSKYENSYEQPYFEMMSRFQQNLRNDNVLLISAGFSFSDKHIVTVIQEAVTQNPSFRLMIINRTIRRTKEMDWFIERAKIQSNIFIIAEDFVDFVKNYPSSKIYDNQEVSE